jgi:hypothetical protein
VPEEIQVPNLPDIQIIQNGKPVDTSAIDDYDSFMAFLMQASIAANTAKIKKYYEDRRSVGRAPSYPIGNITPTQQEIPCAHPSQSLYIYNNGPGQIFVCVNSPSDFPTPIIAGRGAYFPFETHVIERFYVWSDPGTVATATAILKY